MKTFRMLVFVLAVGVITAGVGCSSKTTGTPAPSASSPGAATTTASGATSPGATGTPVPGSQTAVTPEKNPPGDIPDNQAFVAFSAKAGHVAFKVPEGWARSTTPAGVVFTDKLNTIDVSWKSATSAPTISSVKSSDVAAISAASEAFTLTSVTAEKLPIGDAILLRYQINSAPNSVTGKKYRLEVERHIIFRGATRVDVTLLSPVGADNVDPWNIVKKSLTWL